MNSPAPDPGNVIDLTGQDVGDYYLMRRLGRGGMADVYLAEQQSLKRKVALKILKPDLANDHSYVERFRREAQAAAALEQNNIVKIYEVNDFEGLYYIAQEYISGRNLRQFVVRNGAVEPVMVINVIRQVALALQAAAARDVIHRDIKPENIMLSTNGEIKVADFGLARINNQSEKNDLTQIGITMGTPLYMSPEQVQGKAVDPRSDIYSLGITVYHMLAGEPPFDGDNALAIALQHVQKKPERLEVIRPDVPAELCELVHKMMAKDPDNRVQDPSELLREVRKIKVDSTRDWDDLIDQLASADTMIYANQATVQESKLAVTRQLDSVLKGHFKSWWSRPSTLMSFMLLGIAGCVTGLFLAWSNPPADPLDVRIQAIAEEVLRFDTVEEQYSEAYWKNREKDWMAVIEYFPLEDAENANLVLDYHRRAKARLGELYIKNGRHENALEIYTEFYNIADVTDRYNVMGSAGIAIVHDRMLATVGDDELKNKYETIVRAELAKLSAKFEEFLNPFMRKRVMELMAKYSGAAMI